MKLAHSLTAVLVLALAGCVEPEAAAPEIPSGDADTCGAAQHAGLIGGPGEAISGLSFPGPVRVIRPGQPVTMDFSAQRINFELDDAGAVFRITCG